MVLFLKNVNRLVYTIENLLANTLLIIIIFLVFIAALLRWFKMPLVWSIDLSQLLFVWVCFLGADVALSQNRHIGVDVIVRNLPDKIQRIINLTCSFLILIFLLIVIYFGMKLGLSNTSRQFNGMEISYSWATFSAPVGCLLLSRTILSKIYLLLIENKFSSGKPVTRID